MIFVYFEFILYFYYRYFINLEARWTYCVESGFRCSLFQCSLLFYRSQLITNIETVVCLITEALKCVM